MVRGLEPQRVRRLSRRIREAIKAGESAQKAKDIVKAVLASFGRDG